VSGDGNQENVGYFLTNSGGFSGTGCSTCTPSQFLSGSSNPNAAAPSLIELDHTSLSAATALLLNETIDTSLILGYYNAGDTTLAAAEASEVSIIGPGSLTGSLGVSAALSNLTSGEDYGFYITRNCLNIPNCTGTTTWFSNDALNTTDAGDQHFVIFTSATTGTYYIGVEDLGLSEGPNIEGNGDYNDIVFQLTTSVSSAPEPATFGMIGAGLVGLAFFRRARR
jgi:hypothetical protein